MLGRFVVGSLVEAGRERLVFLGVEGSGLTPFSTLIVFSTLIAFSALKVSSFFTPFLVGLRRVGEGGSSGAGGYSGV